MQLPQLGKILIIGGLALVALGGLLLLAGKAGLGRLPGDVTIRKGNLTIYVPIVTCIVLSLLLTLLLNFLFRR